jgi:hypothetical protein
MAGTTHKEDSNMVAAAAVVVLRERHFDESDIRDSLSKRVMPL